MAHTPGPWGVDSERDDFADEGRTLIVLGPQEEVIVQNIGWNERDNATLIAAAPELLEAARLANQELLDLGQGSSASPALRALWMAIAKAEGRTDEQ